MQTLAERLDDLDLKIARWKKRLRVAFNKIDKLEAQRKRLTGLAPKAPKPVPLGKPFTEPFVEPVKQLVPFDDLAVMPSNQPKPAEDVTLDIPEELRRDPNETELKKMNDRIAKRAAARKTKPAKAPASRLLAKAMADNEARNRK